MATCMNIIILSILCDYIDVSALQEILSSSHYTIASAIILFEVGELYNFISKMDVFSPDNMAKLVDLLRAPEPEVLQGEDLATASDIEITSTRDKAPPLKEKQTPKTIEEYEEQEAKEAEMLSQAGGGISDRKTPEYTMNYQQAVTAEDVFLQIGPKTTSSASCENLIVRIKMPGDKKENVDLSVDTMSVTVDSSRYSLKLPLPHDIDPDLSKASWDSSEETLVLTLKLDREFDFVNF